MIGAALDRVFREASGRIVAALASRFRNLKWMHWTLGCSATLSRTTPRGRIYYAAWAGVMKRVGPMMPPSRWSRRRQNATG